SFFGFNEAVKTHCGIEIDRIEKSESFASEVLGFMRNIIEERNQTDNELYILTQPHYDNYLRDLWHNNQSRINNDSNRYNTGLIREDSKLSLKKKIELYTKFAKYLDGGCVFSPGLINLSIKEQISDIIDSKINAFKLEM
ncbi:MAG: hypothetical protein ACFE96_08260, partial [Candidatus Hermodarchaeota archaeon]